MLTSYCGGRSGRLKRLHQNSAKVAIAGLNKAAIRVTRGATSLSSSNYSPACVASATAKPVALPPGRCLPTKSWRGARDHRARIFDYAAGTGPATSSSHRVGLNRKSSPKRRYSP